MFKFMCRVIGILGMVFMSTTLVTAQNVTLNSVDGTIKLTGELLDFDGEFYTIGTAIGEMSIAVSTVNCLGENCPDLISTIEEFTIVGSNLIGDMLLPRLIEAYALERGGDLQIENGEKGISVYSIINADNSFYSTITVLSGSSADAFSALESGQAVIGISSREATIAEQSKFANSGLGALRSAEQEHIIGLDGIIAVVHRDNPIAALSVGQIAQIFAGEITNWSQLGGLAAPISLYRRDEISATVIGFDELAMTPNQLNFLRSATILPSNAAVADSVANNLNGIGITSFAEERDTRALAIRSICGQVSTSSSFSIKTEEYPLSRRIFMYTSSAIRPDRANELINYITSPSGQEIVGRSGFVGQNIDQKSLNEQGRRIANAVIVENDLTSLGNLQNLLTTTMDAERLSLTFRFISGTSNLDNRAKQDIIRLATLIRAGEFTNRQILVLGFTDNIGTANENSRLSQSRAELVREAIVVATGQSNLGNVKITPVGYGNTSPIGCNNTVTGRETNRRVELWLR